MIDIPADNDQHISDQLIFMFAKLSTNVSVMGSSSLLTIFTNTHMVPNGCTGNVITSVFPNIDIGLPLSNTTEEKDGGKGNIFIQMTDELGNEMSNKDCPPLPVAFVLTTGIPKEGVPFNENTIILVAKIPPLILIPWSLYYSHCSDFYLYFVSAG